MATLNNETLVEMFTNQIMLEILRDELQKNVKDLYDRLDVYEESFPRVEKEVFEQVEVNIRYKFVFEIS